MPMETGRRPAYRRFSFHAAISACNARPAASAFAASSAVAIGAPNTPITSSPTNLSTMPPCVSIARIARQRKRGQELDDGFGVQTSRQCRKPADVGEQDGGMLAPPVLQRLDVRLS